MDNKLFSSLQRHFGYNNNVPQQFEDNTHED
jgi:hypothetical protein